MTRWGKTLINVDSRDSGRREVSGYRQTMLSRTFAKKRKARNGGVTGGKSESNGSFVLRWGKIKL